MTHDLGPVIIDIQGHCLAQEDIELLGHPAVGGLILFTRNYDSPEQLIDLIKHIRSLRPKFFIGIDQEGGPVQRLKQPFTELPSLSEIGELFDDRHLNPNLASKITQQMGYLMAVELRSLGIDMSFAPVLDLATQLNPIVMKRAIHHDPEMVGLVAGHYVDGMSKAGMPACGKHFPGHGHVSLDSHLFLPVDDRSFQEISTDLQPFKQLIKHGIQSIMTGHLLFSAIDPLPVTFSKYWLNNVLRQEMSFDGAIISDDLSMKATHTVGDIVTCAHLALEAGCDYLLVCNDRKQAENVVSHITPTFDTKTLSRRNKILSSNGKSTPWHELSKNQDWVSAKAACTQYFAKLSA